MKKMLCALFFLAACLCLAQGGARAEAKAEFTFSRDSAAFGEPLTVSWTVTGAKEPYQNFTATMYGWYSDGTSVKLAHTENASVHSLTCKAVKGANLNVRLSILDGNDKFHTFSSPTIPVAGSYDILSCKVTVKNQVYTGKAIKPAVQVTHDGEKLEKGKDYTVQYANNTKVGTARVIIKGKGQFTGTKTVTFKINPKGTSITKLKSARKKLTVNWKKQSTQVTGYQLEYSTRSTFKGAKKVTVSKAKTVSKVLSKLKGKTLYYVRVRTYKTVSSVKYYSAWSMGVGTKTR